jgi:DNA replication protein DnaC
MLAPSPNGARWPEPQPLANPGRFSLDEAVRQLRAAEAAGRFAKKLQTYLRPAVLVLDEVGYLPLDRAAANMVFQLISRRYERGSVILTSNKAFSEWGSVFADDVLATAILDRLLHHANVVVTKGTQTVLG